tara:strand:+ start:870 stop:1205 length:336 start_codon:yes stop_codon:yes gene_type:complete
MLKHLFQFLWQKADAFLPRRRLVVIDGDVLPKKLPRRNIVLLRDGGEDWSVGFRCPCGCGRTIELLLIEEARPRWNYTVESGGLPTLHPSVWLKTGCKSHFWLRRGRIQWV